MAGNVIIEKADGAQASVNEAQFKKHYPDVKYKVLRDETPADFTLVGVPRQKRVRSKPKAKAAKPKVAAPIAAVPDEPAPVPDPAPAPEARPW